MDARPIAHRTADFGKEAVLIYCGNRVACRQLGQLDAPIDEEAVVGVEKAVGSPAHKCRERGIHLADGADVENLDLQPHRASSCPYVSQCKLGSRSIGRIDKY